MSSIVSEGKSDLKTITNANLEEKRQKFIRSGSIDKIIQFNSYICTQNYFLLPALIAWLKSSQTTFQTQIEKYIISFKSTFVNVLLQVIIFAHLQIKNYVAAVYKSQVCNLYRLKYQLLVVSVYLGLFAIFAQFLICLYFILDICLPLGAMFLYSCISFISYVNTVLCLRYLKTECKNFKIVFFKWDW